MISFAGIAQDRAPATSLAGDAVSSPHPAPKSCRAAFADGYVDAINGRPYRLTPAELIERAGAVDILAYMLGHQAGELKRNGGNACAAK